MPISAILMAVAKGLASKLTSWGYNKITKSNVSEYEGELYEIIHKTIEEFKIINPIKERDKIPFYTSQVLLDEYLKFRYTNKLDQNLIEEVIINDGRIIVPTEAELKLFYEIFDRKIKESKKLYDLNIECNYKEEIFNISKEVKNLQQKIMEIKERLTHQTDLANPVTPFESKLLIRLFDFQSPCRIATAKGEYESLWVPGQMTDMQWGYERTQTEVELSGKDRGDRDNRIHWILVVNKLVERKYLEEQPNRHYTLTVEGNKIAFELKHKEI